jgi:isoquinoline 1-oxidoreductase
VATDVGIAVNPDGIRAQVMGGASWGLSLAMHEIATMKHGAIEQMKFNSYTPLRMEDVPEIDVAIIANGDEYPRGVGEPAVTVIAPALSNSVFNAVGARVRSLPITPEKIRAVMKA